MLAFHQIPQSLSKAPLVEGGKCDMRRCTWCRGSMSWYQQQRKEKGECQISPLPRLHLTGLETRVLAGPPCTSQKTVLMPFLLSPSLCPCLCFSLSLSLSLSLVNLVTELTRSRVIIKSPLSPKSRFCTKQGFEIEQGQCINCNQRLLEAPELLLLPLR